MPLTTNKEVALRSFVNVWLKEHTLFCNVCGNVYKEELMPCCDNPQIGTNKSLVAALVQENKMLRETRKNVFASDDKKNIRWGISIIPRLLHDLEEYSEKVLKEKLWNTPEEMNAFMRAFPEFTIPERI